MLQTPPQTQSVPTPMAIDTVEAGLNTTVERHTRFYETGGSLQDPVILRVRMS